jgi:PAS domain S-box-containing protein
MALIENASSAVSPAAAGSRWRPLSPMQVFAAGEYPAFVLGFLWFGLTALCIWWPIANFGPHGFTWNEWLVWVGGVRLDFTFYLPWTVCVCLVMWLGLEWAAFTAYLATLFSTLHKGMAWDLSLVNALHNPLAMAVFFLFYCNYSGDYTLRSARSWGWFLLASLAASMMSSLGAFISQFTNTPIGAQGFLSAWLGWWPNAFGQTLITSLPLIYLFSPGIERLKKRYFPRARTKPFSPQELVMAASMFALTLVLLILVSDQWQAGRTQALLSMSMPEAARSNIINQLGVQRFLAWLLALMLAGLSLGGVYFAVRWARRMQSEFDHETQEARAAQRRSEANFRHFFENNPAPMFIYLRETGACLDVNLAAVERYGYSREEFLKMTIFDIRPPEDVARLKEHMQKTSGTETGYRAAGEWRHVTKSGEIMDVDIRVSYMNLDGRAINLVLVHDISPRKHAQAAVERRARELQTLAVTSLEITGAKSVEEVLEVVVVRARKLVGAKLAVAKCWPQAEDEKARTRTSMAGEYHGLRGFKALPESDAIRQLLLDKQYAVRLSTEELRGYSTLARPLVEADGHPPVHGLLAVPLTAGSDVIGALVASDKDSGEFDVEDEALLVQLAQVTSAGIESVRLSEQLRRHMEELEQRVGERTAELDTSNQALDAFAHSVAHDLRAPLRAMHGFADAVLEDYGPKLDDTGRDYLGRIINGAKKLDTLIQDLLSYSRIGRGQTVLEAVDLGEVVAEALAALSHDIEVMGAQVETRIPPLTVLAHKATLRQVMFNLKANALKFVAPGVKPRVEVWAEAHGGMVDIWVRDNGIGIAPEHRERIFSVFERLHGTEDYSGTGIGLSIVKKGLTSMMGEISVESDGQHGSTFHARLKEFKSD